jgi:hypothetical protein
MTKPKAKAKLKLKATATTPSLTPPLTPTQRLVLEHAVQETAGQLQWFPGTVKGGARTKLLSSLFDRGLIIGLDPEWIVTAEGYDALGLPHPIEPPTTPATRLKIASRKTSTIAPAAASPTSSPAPSRVGADSKQSQVIAMLSRTSGATVTQITEATGWQAHTVRGFFAGALKKKLGISLTSIKTDGAARTYRIPTTDPKESA